MRKTGLIGTIAALVILVVAAPSLCLGQSLKQADELQRKVIELLNAGEYSQAMPLAQRVLSLREAALGPDHLDVARALNNLALVYDSQSRHHDAEPLFKRSLAIREKSLGPDQPMSPRCSGRLMYHGLIPIARYFPQSR
jgi:tetratricopeptide (TPR) repeat protein